MRRIYVLFVVGIVLFGAFSAQKTYAQNANVAQRIIGTWVEQDGTIWVFNANGNLTWGKDNVKFAVTDTKLAISKGRSVNIYDLSMSSDGKTVIITYLDDGDTEGYWLTKK
jgi:uncharacterized protein (DUF2147 family)